MLKLRVITALVLFVVVMGALFGLERSGFALVAGIFFVAAGWEWSNLMGQLTTWLRAVWVLSLIALLTGVELLRPGWIFWLALSWLPALLLVVCYPQFNRRWNQPIVLALVGWLLLVPSFAAVVAIKANGALGLAGPWALLAILVWVWAADIGAYFSGRRFGKHKLAPQVSPGKTIEGLLGGVLLALAVTLALLWLAPIDASAGQLLLVALVTVLASVLGDLFESMAKRERGVKDSGTMLPGHGGMLDRIDSVTAALPVAAAMMMWLGMPGGGLM